MQKSSFFLRFLASFLVFLFVSTPLFQAVAYAQVSSSESVVLDETLPPPPSYPELMRRFRALQTGQEIPGGEETLLSHLTRFLSSEKKRMEDLHVPYFKKHAYTALLRKQIRALGGTPAIWDKIRAFFEELFGIEPEEGIRSILDEATLQGKKVEEGPKLPENPSSFQFPDEIPSVQSITNLQVVPDDTGSPTPTILEKIKDIITIEEVGAATGTPPIPYEFLPTLEDTMEDGREVMIPQEIQDLALSLHQNPVEIFSFLRNSITYAPYYGARKGSIGCLKDLVCNDTDASSLGISLFRASGIPARYKKSLIVVPVSQLKNLLGVDETKSVYAAFALNKVPVFTIVGNDLSGSLDSADFSSETHLALQWTFLQIFYEYDERGGNISNGLSFSSASSTDDVRSILQSYPKKQWISLDVVMRPYTRTTREIVHDTAGFNTDSFWNGFFGYQGTFSPVSKYIQDLISQTGKDIRSTSYQSSRALQPFPFEILPNTLPYVLRQGTAEGISITPETWSSLPDSQRAKVAISLLRGDNRSSVFSHTFYASEIENAGIELLYEGKTDSDKAIIQSYGGIHATPSALVDIVPVFETGGARYPGTEPLQIGKSMILSFSYGTGNQTIMTDEKFSTAGNTEGIFMTFSRARLNPVLDTPAKILLGGNTEIARSYLLHVQEQGDILSKSLDYAYQTGFTRAVVTQNRILSTIDGTPTTFDFKGLTIDASSYITDYSNRGNYKNHRKDFRLLFGLEASYYEGQIFTDLAGLEGISTVKGLQYASARPSDYTIHTITQANESVIDTLDLSQNTKANMHTDVQAGKTITTPQKPVQKDTWRGIFYTSISPDGTGTYAIGEQTGGGGAGGGVQNGGWTTSDLLLYAYTGEGSEERNGFLRQFGSERLYYEDRQADGVLCRITDAEYNAITTRPDWSPSFGYPCSIGSVNFGDITHAYIQTSNASHFLRPDSYDYWEYLSTIRTKLKNYISNLSPEDTYTMRFSLLLGTYLQSICMDKGFFNCKNSAYESVYYVPYQNGEDHGRVYRLKQGFLSKASEDNDGVIRLLGFPTSDEASAARSPEGTEGTYQNFTNGQMYYYSKWLLPWVYYTYGKITKTHNENGGTGGQLGFPKSDPEQKGNFIYQEFESGNGVEWSMASGLAIIKVFKKYGCEMNGDIHDVRLLFIMAHGVLDTGVATVADSANILGSAAKAALHPIQSAKEVYELAQAVGNVDVKAAKAFLAMAGGAVRQGLLEEYDTSIGPNGCEARSNYLGGRVVGEVILIAIPASKLKAVTKVKLLEKISKLEELYPGVKLITKSGFWGKIVEFTKAEDIAELNRVRAITTSYEKGLEGENFVARFLKVGEQQIDFPTESLGNRVVDVWDANKHIANEVKTWSTRVPLNAEIRDQIAKDIALMNELGANKYRPVWHFLQEGPTGPLAVELQRGGIEFIVYNMR